LHLRRLPLRLAPAIVLALAPLLGPRAARAQTAADKAAAEALFDEGKKLVEAGKIAEACPKFEESQRLDAGLGTMLYLADCYERAGRTASAWATFREAAASARAAGQADREQIARARAEALEPRLHRHALRVEDASEGLTLELVDAGGRREALARATWGVALPIDPGAYRVEATAPGRAPWSAAIVVPATAGTTTTVVPPLAAAQPAPSPAPSPPPAPPPAPPEAPLAPGEGVGDGQRVAGLTVGVVGLGALALTGVFTAIALSNEGDADDLCGEGPTCADPEGVAASEDAVAMGNVATVSLVAGGALIAAGAVLYLTAPDGAPPASGAAPPRGRFIALTPSSPGADAGVSLGGAF
jgi:serine/threonine-protein kinase